MADDFECVCVLWCILIVAYDMCVFVCVVCIALKLNPYRLIFHKTPLCVRATTRADKRVLDYPLMDNPFAVIGILCIYIMLVYRWGPRQVA